MTEHLKAGDLAPLFEKSYAELKAESEQLFEDIAELTKERNNLPRSAKQEAHKLLAEINSLMAKHKRLKTPLARAYEKEQSRENHSLWCGAVAELFGEEALKECFTWMKEERRRRRESQ